MKFVPFDVDANLREMTKHGDDDFPVVAYLRRMNKKEEGFLILHWHEEIQFVIPLSGPILFTVCDTSYTLTPNEFLFINSARLHRARPLDSVGGDYICIDIHPKFLCGYSAGMVGQKYVHPFLSADAIPAIVMDGAESWHEEAKELLRKLVRVYEAKEYAYELAVQKIVLGIWLLIVQNCREKSDAGVLLSQTEQKRLDCIVEFIKEHYAQKLTLSELAAAGRLSTGECCRLVKRALGLSPMIYLNNFRLVKSANLLQTTDLSITEIAQATGFSSSSYYTAQFKKLMNCRPLEYRRRFRLGQLSPQTAIGKQIRELL